MSCSNSALGLPETNDEEHIDKNIICSVPVMMKGQDEILPIDLNLSNDNRTALIRILKVPSFFFLQTHIYKIQSISFFLGNRTCKSNTKWTDYHEPFVFNRVFFPHIFFSSSTPYQNNISVFFFLHCYHQTTNMVIIIMMMETILSLSSLKICMSGCAQSCMTNFLFSVFIQKTKRKQIDTDFT